jgi:hypothetical protein
MTRRSASDPQLVVALGVSIVLVFICGVLLGAAIGKAAS